MIDYKKEIALKNLEARLMSQQASCVNCEAEILKYREHIERYEATMVSLEKEIQNTREMIEKLKGGEK